MPTKIRSKLSKRNPYYISKERYYELKHFCLQYKEWKQCMDNKAQYNIDLVKNISLKIDNVFSYYILKAVTEGLTYEQVKTRYGIPCCRDNYYKMYREFFYILDKSKY